MSVLSELTARQSGTAVLLTLRRMDEWGMGRALLALLCSRLGVALCSRELLASVDSFYSSPTEHSILVLAL